MLCNLPTDGYGPGVSMVDLEESAGHAAPPQGGFEPNLTDAAQTTNVSYILVHIDMKT